MAPNLIPFTGLDDCWPLADTLRIPDLAHRSRGTLTQLITSLTGENPVTAGDWMLAGYRALNGLAAAALLATAPFFWHQIFGDLTASLIQHGPPVWPGQAAAHAPGQGG